jgi:hypothetical protein
MSRGRESEIFSPYEAPALRERIWWSATVDVHVWSCVRFFGLPLMKIRRMTVIAAWTLRFRVLGCLCFSSVTVHRTASAATGCSGRCPRHTHVTEIWAVMCCECETRCDGQSGDESERTEGVARVDSVRSGLSARLLLAHSLRWRAR